MKMGRTASVFTPGGAGVNSQGRQPLDFQRRRVRPLHRAPEGRSNLRPPMGFRRSSGAPRTYDPMASGSQGLTPWLFTTAPPGLSRFAPTKQLVRRIFRVGIPACPESAMDRRECPSSGSVVLPRRAPRVRLEPRRASRGHPPRFEATPGRPAGWRAIPRRSPVGRQRGRLLRAILALRRSQFQPLVLRRALAATPDSGAKPHGPAPPIHCDG